MKEDFLHYLWKFKKFDFFNAKTSDGESVVLLQTGLHNQHQSGPDFFNAKIKIGEQLWAGNVEIHIKSSDWYAHGHETDPAYDNVILHVVWEHDVEVYRKNNSPVPTLILKDLIHQNALENYRNLLQSNSGRWINCESDFPDFTDFEIQNWLERLYIERLEEKSNLVEDILQKTTNDWEATLFCLLAKNFGLNVNGEVFLSLALSIPYSVVRKMNSWVQMEAILFGQAGMLSEEREEPYFNTLSGEYNYLKHKFKLNSEGVLPVNYFRLRPQNFPTIRLAQLANLLFTHKNLFADIIEENDIDKIRNVFKIAASDFWKTHYNFDKESASRTKKLSSGFIDLVIINTIIPLKFCYFRHKGIDNHESLFALMRQIPEEKNSIVDGFNKIRPKTGQNALDSQALIQLKKNYCDKNLCLQCSLGLKILQKE